MDIFSILPVELWSVILGWLRKEDIFNVKLINKRMNRIVKGVVGCSVFCIALNYEDIDSIYSAKLGWPLIDTIKISTRKRTRISIESLKTCINEQKYIEAFSQNKLKKINSLHDSTMKDINISLVPKNVFNTPTPLKSAKDIVHEIRIKARNLIDKILDYKAINLRKSLEKAREYFSNVILEDLWEEIWYKEYRIAKFDMPMMLSRSAIRNICKFEGIKLFNSTLRKKHLIMMFKMLREETSAKRLELISHFGKDCYDGDFFLQKLSK